MVREHPVPDTVGVNLFRGRRIAGPSGLPQPTTTRPPFGARHGARAGSRLAVAFLVAVAAGGLAVAGEAADCTVNWIGAGGDGGWGTAANWDTGVAPSDTDIACAESGADIVVI